MTRNLNNSSLLGFLPSVEMTNNDGCTRFSGQGRTFLWVGEVKASPVLLSIVQDD